MRSSEEREEVQHFSRVGPSALFSYHTSAASRTDTTIARVEAVTDEASTAAALTRTITSYTAVTTIVVLPFLQNTTAHEK